ncbi:MAG: valine--tRNA ligase [Deltaproteobacteria bacterium]|nr:valine--tRNA ligase [Deltaproteobacteria bacterium]
MSESREAPRDDGKSLSKIYDPAAVEAPIYQRWLDAKVFHATPDDRPRDRRYVIMMPLPNVTGALHMGHAMDNVIQDLLTRWHRMMGDNALWMPGTDHARIATQAIVEKRLKELEGKTRYDVGREGLVERIWSWKEQFQARIIAQQQRMGCGCDWDRQRFTMDAVCARAVRHTFFRMFDEGLIFRGKRLVNWDVFLQTSVSDDEVYHETVKGHFWHLRYPVIDPLPGEPTHVEVATTRPETMLGDTAVAVHPDPAGALEARIAEAQAKIETASAKERVMAEEALAALLARKEETLPALIVLRDMAKAGRRVRLPLMERSIPLVLDTWAKPELGSGCVKITPAHDPNDFDVWTRHKAEIDRINILDPDGTLNENAGAYAGLDRFSARDKVVSDLNAVDLLGEVEDRDVEVGHSDRSKTPVEPYLSDQWFVHMGDVAGGVTMGRGTERSFIAPGLVQAAMDAVTDGRVSIHPPRYTKTYLDWLSEKRDWPISRQLWWGHQIPVWSRQGLWRDIDLTTLTPLLDASGERISARVHRLDGGGSVKIEADGRLGSDAPAADERCAVDVCLLGDDDDVRSALEAAGYVRDPDVLDTWFSSALWPHSTLGWPDPKTAPIDAGQASLVPVDGAADALDFYYPGSCLVTGRDIITLWVARMVLAGLYNIGDVPFSDVFIHANILDGKGERMSKSKGNGIDPVDIIEQYGTDAMRYVLCEMQTGTQDIRLPVLALCPHCGGENDLAKTKASERSVFIRVCFACGKEFDVLGTMPEIPAGKLVSKRFEVGRAFCTKLWNSARFAFQSLEGGPIASSVDRDALALEDRWILDGLDQAAGAVQAGLRDYNLAVAIGAARDFFWGALCDWYLELIKPRLAGEAAEGEAAQSAQVARRVLAYALDQVLRMLHPFVPFITEHLWQRLGELLPDRSLGEWAKVETSELLVEAAWPTSREALTDVALRETFADLQAQTRAIRDVRASAGISPRKHLEVTTKVPADRAAALGACVHIVDTMAHCETTVVSAFSRRAGDAVKVAGDLEIFVHEVIDDAAERERLGGEKKKAQKERAICEKKLGNAKFVDRAPAKVVAEQRERAAHYRASLEAIERALSQLA